MVLYKSTTIFNDLDNKANTSHTHSNYALSSHTHSSYVTSTQVTNIVNTAISNGTIEVNSSMFKSITTYNYSGRILTPVEFTGPGMVTVHDSNVGYINIDGSDTCLAVSGGCYLFQSSLAISTGMDKNYYIKATVGLF